MSFIRRAEAILYNHITYHVNCFPPLLCSPYQLQVTVVACNTVYIRV